MRSRTSVFAVLVSLAAPGLAHAQPADTHTIAEEQFQRGRDAIKKGDYKLALKLLRTSQGLEAGRGKLFNMAFCEEQLAMVASALRHYQGVLPQFPAGDERIEIVKLRVGQLEPRVPRVRIDLAAGAPAGTTVTLDGEPIAPTSLGAEMAIDPGKHVIAASVGGGREKRYEIVVAERGHTGLSVEPERAALAVAPLAREAPAPPAAEPPPSTGRPLRWRLGVAAVSVGGASLFVGLATGVATGEKRAALLSACTLAFKCPSSQQGTLNAFHTLSAVSTTTVIVGGALAAAGVVLLVLPPPRQQAPMAWVRPLISAGTVGLQGGF